jgi:cobalt-zinc-cadmium efflux system protein
VKSEKRMLISFILNFLFTIFEFFGGIITNSVALISDSVHDLGDSISIGVAIYLEKKSKQKRDFKYTYGYYRFSLLGGLITAIILLVGSTIVVIEAVKRLINPEEINAELMIYFAIVGVIVNGLAALNAKRGESANEKLITLHMLEDVFGWIALLIVAILMSVFDIKILDSLLSIGFTIFIVYHVIRNLKSILEVFLEKAPKGYSINNIKAELLKIDKVRNIHHIHLWTLEGSIPIITLHARVDKLVKINEVITITKKLDEKLKDLGIMHSTIQVEFLDGQCNELECEDLEVKGKHKH